ncbi:uncharacterized protein LOC133182547 [Saccostrea echinata]|uniref:uncharacterized protein LOC133182547 n=1 Tax=Saccostrea echinata TaxID=191078 RepID=UPI002A80AC22|nr:uncharacterized protein LOC133182547 [Saccostrea echinata]
MILKLGLLVVLPLVLGLMPPGPSYGSRANGGNSGIPNTGMNTGSSSNTARMTPNNMNTLPNPNTNRNAGRNMRPGGRFPGNDLPYQCTMYSDAGYFCPYGYPRPGTRYFFNTYSGRCESFFYLGCGGNLNTYSSRDDCIRSCACFTYPDPGNYPCYHQSTRRWYFNRYSGTCQQFYFSGCNGGNDNNFRSQLECQSACGPEPCNGPWCGGIGMGGGRQGGQAAAQIANGNTGAQAPSPAMPSQPAGINGMPAIDQPNVAMPTNNRGSSGTNRMTIDMANSMANANNVIDMNSFAKIASSAMNHNSNANTMSMVYPTPNQMNSGKAMYICDMILKLGLLVVLPLVLGLMPPGPKYESRANGANRGIPNSGMNTGSSSNTARITPNNMNTLPNPNTNRNAGRNMRPGGRFPGGDLPYQCTMYSDAGYFCPYGYPRPGTRYFFNTYSGRCESFFYLGCGGNLNTYSSRDDCVRSCACFTYPARGIIPCYHLTRRWYFNKYSGTCQQFYFSGCNGGNDNNFQSQLECQSACGPEPCNGPWCGGIGMGDGRQGGQAAAQIANGNTGAQAPFPAMPSQPTGINGMPAIDQPNVAMPTNTRGSSGTNTNTFVNRIDMNSFAKMAFSPMNPNSNANKMSMPTSIENDLRSLLHASDSCQKAAPANDQLRVQAMECYLSGKMILKLGLLVALPLALGIIMPPGPTYGSGANGANRQTPNLHFGQTLNTRTNAPQKPNRHGENMKPGGIFPGNELPYQCTMYRDSGYFCPYGYPRPGTRYFFNVYSRRCESFFYLGCGGNLNSYSSREDCIRSCACFTYPDRGVYPCSYPNTRRWYFNRYSGTCRPFYFSGCNGGNDNNFQSQLECQSACGPEPCRGPWCNDEPLMPRPRGQSTQPALIGNAGVSALTTPREPAQPSAPQPLGLNRPPAVGPPNSGFSTNKINRHGPIKTDTMTSDLTSEMSNGNRGIDMASIANIWNMASESMNQDSTPNGMNLVYPSANQINSGKRMYI